MPVTFAVSQRAQGLQSNPLLDLVEWRGVSYAAGGDAGATTIPNVRALVFRISLADSLTARYFS